jgi:hypothetical protein
VPETLRARSIDIHEDFLFVGCHTAAVRVYDIAEPESPNLVSTLNDRGEAYGVSFEDGRLAVGDLQRGVQIWDLRSAKSPRCLAHNGHYGPHSLHYDGVYVYVAAESGFHILTLGSIPTADG